MSKSQIYHNILEKISIEPEKLKKIKTETKELLDLLKKNNLKAEVGGSLAKGTMLKKDNQDVDIFIILEPKEISLFEKLISKTKLAYQVVHGSRDYIRVQKEEITFELIPVLKLKKNEKVENVTDFSLTHVRYIKAQLAKNKELADEILLAKAFCYANNCYGAESYIGGFSGYALEVLVCYFRSFQDFIKKIKKERIIDPEKNFKNKNEIMRELNQSKLQSPLILIDPTYKYRNVCAGLTFETFQIFLSKAEQFLSSPSETFFEKKDFNLENFIKKSKEKNLESYELKITTDKQEGDIAGTKMKKIFKFLIKSLEKKEQTVEDSQFIYSGGKEATAYLSIKFKPSIEVIGPPKEMKESVKKFEKVRKNTYLSKGFVCAKEEISLEEIFNNNLQIAESMKTYYSFKKI